VYVHTLVEVRAQGFELNLTKLGFVFENPSVVRVIVDDLVHCTIKGQATTFSLTYECTHTPPGARTISKQRSPHRFVKSVVNAVKDALARRLEPLASGDVRTRHQQLFQRRGLAKHREPLVSQVATHRRCHHKI
jgi:hypothetical protein